MSRKFPFIPQHRQGDCGIACLLMVSAWHGQWLPEKQIFRDIHSASAGISLLEMARVAEKYNFITTGCKLSLIQLQKDVQLPAIIHWNSSHFVVLHRISGCKGRKKYHIADPARGKQTLSEKEFLSRWCDNNYQTIKTGIALLLSPGKDFHDSKYEKEQRTSISKLFALILPHRRFLRPLFIGILAGSIIQVLFPFLTQAIVDTGIQYQDLNFITVILLAQLMLMVSQSLVEIIRERILLHISTRINFSMVKDFIVKLMRLPVRDFYSGMTGEFLQRVADQTRVESFLTSGSIRLLFSAVNLLFFSIVMMMYDVRIFLVFLAGSVLHFLWVMAFLKRRKYLDKHRFMELSEHQTRLIEIINGMKDIRISGSELQKRWRWEEVQAGLFRINTRSLTINQFQNAGALIFNQSKNILITFMAALSVIHGDITLGMMLAIQYILGQANVPIEGMALIIREFQDAFLSLERIEEIHDMDEEIDLSKQYFPLQEAGGITFEDVTFCYSQEQESAALKNFSLHIPEGKTTAIVGSSGCGKTTVINLLLGVYKPGKGGIRVGNQNLSSINLNQWRYQCGVVMQDGYIFNDTIAANITLGADITDFTRLSDAVSDACLEEEMKLFPHGIETKIGEKGRGLSNGQKQRILLARAIYKNPRIFLFDEATNSLDANNEETILKNLTTVLKNKTVIMAAHRLSTIKNADQIIVMDMGRIVETGSHSTLMKNRGHYFHLIKKQTGMLNTTENESTPLS